MITVQSKGAGSLKLPRGRLGASRLGRVAERPMQARMPDLGKGRGSHMLPELFPYSSTGSSLPESLPPLYMSIYIRIIISPSSQRLASERSSGSQKHGGAPR